MNCTQLAGSPAKRRPCRILNTAWARGWEKSVEQMTTVLGGFKAEPRRGRPGAVDAPAASASVHGLDIDVIADEAGFAALETEWRRLEAIAEACCVFTSFDWAFAWWSHFGAGSGARLAVVTARHGGELVAVLPLQVRARGFYASAEPMGSGSGQYGGALIDTARVAFDDAFAALWAGARNAGIDSLLVDNVAFGSPLDAHLIARAAHAGSPIDSVQIDGSAFADFDAYWAARSSNTRKGVRRRRRKLEEAHAVTYERITDPRAFAGVIDELVQLKRGWLADRGLHGRLIARDGFAGWLTDLAHRMARQNRLHLSVERVDGRIAAGQIAFLKDGLLTGYLSAFDVTLSQFAIGKVHLQDILTEVVANDLVFDLMPPADDYKLEWAAPSMTVRSYRDPLTPLGRVVTAFHNPRLREAIKRLYMALPPGLRAAAGALVFSAPARLRTLISGGAEPSHSPRQTEREEVGR